MHFPQGAGCADRGNGPAYLSMVFAMPAVFYCPSSQNDPGVPMTNTIAFENPMDYADYVNRFNIQGVSFSGGEPFLTFERVLSFLETLKACVDHPVYTWIYTQWHSGHA